MDSAQTQVSSAPQEIFLTCYRGTQSGLRHAAYMRMAKVFLLQSLLAKWNVSLDERRIFDFGFGAGTFFRYCPHSSRLFGVELDPVCVREVATMLSQRGYRQVDLQPIKPPDWADHPLLQNRYDLIICSHVLEHLPDPEAYLSRIAACLEPGALFVGLVPINERRLDPHHVREIDLGLLQRWLPAAKLELIDWVEADPWLYWMQPLLCTESPPIRAVAQFVSLTLGVAATGLGHARWFRLSRIFGSLSRSKPTQAGFLLRSSIG